MITCKITIPDQVNVLITGLSPSLKAKVTDRLKWRTANCFHTPKYKLGIWDGYIHMFKNGKTFLNLLDDSLIEMIAEHGYEFDIVDNRISTPVDIEPIDKDLFSEFNGPDGKPVEIRDYQVHAVNQTVDNNCGIFVMATGSGKTLVTAALASRFGDHGKVIVIVPTIDLVQQTAKTFNAMGLPCGEFYGEEKIVKEYTISTWQSLINYPEILEGCVCLIADECHEYTAKEVFELMTVSGRQVPHRYGFTGTLPKDELGKNQLRAALGPVLYEKSAYDLQQAGYLSDCHIRIIQTKENIKKFDSFPSEIKYLTSVNDSRVKFIADTIYKISKTGNTLVLVQHTKFGEKLESMIPDSVFMAGSGKNKVTSKNRHIEYSKMNDDDNKTIICTYGIASTGIDIPRIFNLVIIEPGKSFTKVIQSIGRSLRRAKDKSFADVYDICATSKYSNSHKLQRIKFYKEAKYPYSVEKVDYDEISD